MNTSAIYPLTLRAFLSADKIKDGNDNHLINPGNPMWVCIKVRCVEGGRMNP